MRKKVDTKENTLLVQNSKQIELIAWNTTGTHSEYSIMIISVLVFFLSVSTHSICSIWILPVSTLNPVDTLALP